MNTYGDAEYPRGVDRYRPSRPQPHKTPAHDASPSPKVSKKPVMKPRHRAAQPRAPPNPRRATSGETNKFHPVRTRRELTQVCEDNHTRSRREAEPALYSTEPNTGEGKTGEHGNPQHGTRATATKQGEAQPPSVSSFPSNKNKKNKKNGEKRQPPALQQTSATYARARPARSHSRARAHPAQSPG